MDRDQLYLSHILDCIEKIHSYIQDLDQKAFEDNSMVQDAVIRQLEIIGEATKRLSDTLRQAHPDIPWQDMAGMRDILIHDYLNVDVDIVWKTAESSIPHLKTLLERFST